MKYTKIIGIDPGASGGIAVYNCETKSIFSGKMPIRKVTIKNKITPKGNPAKRSETDTSRLMLLIKEYGAGAVAIIERVQARPSDADNPGKRFQINRMLANYEAIKATLTVCGVPYAEVVPLSWQKGLKVWIKGQSKADRKNHFKECAQMWFPTEKVTMANADALLLTRFGFYKLTSDPGWIEERLVAPPENTLL